jgi:mono/diheme cytochrome c family protein
MSTSTISTTATCISRPTRRRPRRARVPLGLAVLTVLVWLAGGPDALAAGDADAAKGIIAEHCVGCHEVPGFSSAGLPTVEAPSLGDVANDPNTYSEARLRKSLQQPHWPMTQFSLSPSDIDNLLAFIASLRSQ